MPTHSLKLNYSRAHMAARASRKIKAAGGGRAVALEDASAR
jgi:hypothetical protein